PHTAAAAEALSVLGERHYRAERFYAAAHCYAQLLGNVRAATPSIVQLYQATAAFRRTWDVAGALAAWKKLAAEAKHAGKVKLHDQELTLQGLRDRLEREVPLPEAQRDWRTFRGNPSRSATRTTGFLPQLSKPSWQRPLLLDDGDDKGQEARAVVRQE